jgi:trimethylamine-N-oxide reductase (cytochrome c)
MAAILLSRRTFTKAVGGLAAVLAVSGRVGLLKPQTFVNADTEERILTCCDNPGPFLGHVQNGRWTKSSALEPNIPIAPPALNTRNRAYAPDRIRYPMKRVDYDPNGNRNTQNRGSLQFVRISWDQAMSIVASEITRVKNTYGPTAIMALGTDHRWLNSLNDVRTWWSKFFNLIGEYTVQDGEGSTPGWNAGTYVMTGGGPVWAIGYSFYFQGSYPSNNYADLLQNCQLMIFWSTDPVSKSYTHSYDRVYIQKLKEAGVQMVVIDSWLNDTAALYADKFIPIIPGTDEALLAAIAYVWIQDGIFNQAWLDTHTMGFDETHLPAGAPPKSSFKSYIMGDADGIPKTPEWAASITGVEAPAIRALAKLWASKRTFLYSANAGANRRQWGATWVRMIMTLQAMQGYLGVAGCGVGAPSIPSPISMKGPLAYAFTPHVDGNFPPRIHHTQFKDAMLNPPITWTTGDAQYAYPREGASEVHMIFNSGGSGYFFNQISNVNDHIKGVKSPGLETVVCCAAWWHVLPYHSDIVLPVSYMGERDDMVSWLNYAVYVHKLVDPPGEARSDLDIFRDLASRLGLLDKLTGGKSDLEILQDIYSKTNVPLSFDQFKEVGFYRFTQPVLDAPNIRGKAFYDDPVKNPLGTKSGKLEIYSQKIADFYGTSDPGAPVIPMYKPSMEGRTSVVAQKYPLQLVTPHLKFGRHSQWHNMSWLRDDEQGYPHGYNALRINPIDAKARNIINGDIIRVFNDRGQALMSAKITERVMPGVVWTWEGGHYTPQQPGILGTLDIGGNVNTLLPAGQMEKISHGQLGHTGLVQVEKWSP